MRYHCANCTDKHYEGKEIKVCNRWLEPKGLDHHNFAADLALRPHRRSTLEHIDLDGHYNPANYVWATRKSAHGWIAGYPHKWLLYSPADLHSVIAP